MINTAAAILAKHVETISMSLVGGSSAMVAYLHKISKGEEFSALRFFVNILGGLLMSFMFDNIISGLLGEYNEDLETAAMVVVGISAFKLLELIEHDGVDIIVRWVHDRFCK